MTLQEVLPLLLLLAGMGMASEDRDYDESEKEAPGVYLEQERFTTAPAAPMGKEVVDALGLGPTFDPSTALEVTVLVGKTAYLHCRVRNLGNRTVSWVRHRDVHILTVGRYTYTSDQRFIAHHHRHSDDWTLQIKYSQPRDSGLYECQVSTQPHRSLFVNLHVIEETTVKPLRPWEELLQAVMTEGDSRASFSRRRPLPRATILGGPDVHVDQGSRINLTCVIQHSPEPPAYVFWYHHDQVLSHDSARGGISIVTEKGKITSSSLLIQSAKLTDSGKYSCSPSNADVASVTVHVLNGERPAAMQSGAMVNSRMDVLSVLLVLLSLASFMT